MPEQHAQLPASSSSRWINCAGSVRKSRPYEGGPSGHAAMMGTAAHSIGEYCLTTETASAYEMKGTKVFVGEDLPTVMSPPRSKTYRKKAPKGYTEFLCDDDMCAGVDTYLAKCREVLAELTEPEYKTETYFNLSDLDPRLGGTGDFHAWDMDRCVVVDYKNGRIVVEVKGNTQLKIYALGALRLHPHVRSVTVWIVQPNAPHEDGRCRDVTYTAGELRAFEKTLVAAARATDDPDAPLKAGDWCTWCPAKHNCEALDAKVGELAQADFDDDPTEGIEVPTDNDRLARLKRWTPLIDAWIKGIDGAVKAALMAGETVGDNKLVRGRSNRVWAGTEAATVRALLKAGAKRKDLYSEPKLLGPSPVEKLGPKVKAAVAKLTDKPPGRVTVAGGDDPRPALDAAELVAEDFGGEHEEA